MISCSTSSNNCLLLANLRNETRSLCLKLFNQAAKIEEEEDTRAICLKSVSRQLKRVAVEQANARLLELEREKGT